MTSSSTLPGRKGFGLRSVINTRRISRTRLSRIILTATGLAVGVGLLVWLTVWINPARRGVAGRWIAQRGLARPWFPHQSIDVERITGAARGALRESPYESFRDILRDHLDRAGNRPVVLYISAAGVLDDQGAVLLRDDLTSVGSPGEPDTGPRSLSLDELLAVFRDAGERFPAQAQLLIWDAGQVGSDRNLGVYANGFLLKLRSALAEKPSKKLAILCSCAPGQTSWSSEVDGRSVFGYFVERNLYARGGRPQGLTVRAFSRRVRDQVSLWVRNHRQAEQTPELLGDESVDFPLPRLRETARAPQAKGEGGDDSERLLKRLGKAWMERDAWQARRPYRDVPRAWLRYLESLLRAERHLRAGELAEAEQTLNALPNLANERKRVPPLGGSMAMLERTQASVEDPSRRAELSAARENLQEALDTILGGEDASQPPKDEGGEPSQKATDGADSLEKRENPGTSKPAETPATKKAGIDRAAPKSGAAELPSDAPNAVGDRPPDSPARKGTSTLSTRSLTLRRRAASPLGRLVAAEDNQRPLYPEAQLLVWANTFVSKGPVRHAFQGRRGEALEESIKLRMLAEEAAASDERISRWIRPWVDAGDRSRRRAQDLLFDSDAAISACLEALEKAGDAYLDAKKNAEICEEAIDLVERLSAELPYYGEWKARRSGRLEPGLDPPFVELLDATAELARRIHEAPPTIRSPDEPLSPLDEKIQQIKAQTAIVTRGFRSLGDDFRNQWEGGRWRDLDGALSVPFIPADVRMRMLDRVRSRTVASSLIGASPTGPSSGSGGTAGQPGDRGAIGDLRLPRVDLSGDASSSDLGESAIESATVDPGFWRLASGLARLEVGLLAIGGAKPDEVTALREAIERACRRLGNAPFADFADLSERIRHLRGLRLAAVGAVSTSELPYHDLAATDRAVRVMPLADSSSRLEGVPEALLRAQRRDLMTWQGQRLLEDFAPRHALAIYEKAKGDYGDSAELQSAAEKAREMTRARIVVETDAPENFTIDDVPSRALAVKVKPEGVVPAGLAVAFVAYDAQAPLSVKGKGGKAEDSVVLPVSIDSSNPPQQASFEVERADSTPESVTVWLEPGAFYRGHIFPKDLSASSLSVRLNPSKQGIDVLLKQSDRRIVQRYGDQFDRHPGQGFLHPHTPLAYKFVINHAFPKTTRVWVRYGLEGKDETFVTRPDLKLEPGRPNEELKDRVDTDVHEIPIDKPRYLTLEIRKENKEGTVLYRRRYPFRQISPSEYMRVQYGFDELLNMAYVNVWHLRSDPVSGPSELTVMLGGQSLSNTLDRGRAEQWWRVYPQPPQPVLWRIQVEKVLDAFRGVIETGVPPPQPPKPPAQ